MAAKPRGSRIPMATGFPLMGAFQSPAGAGRCRAIRAGPSRTQRNSGPTGDLAKSPWTSGVSTHCQSSTVCLVNLPAPDGAAGCRRWSGCGTAQSASATQRVSPVRGVADSDSSPGSPVPGRRPRRSPPSAETGEGASPLRRLSVTTTRTETCFSTASTTRTCRWTFVLEGPLLLLFARQLTRIVVLTAKRQTASDGRMVLVLEGTPICRPQPLAVLLTRSDMSGLPLSGGVSPPNSDGPETPAQRWSGGDLAML